MTSPLAFIYSSIDSVKRQLMDAFTNPVSNAQKSISHGMENLKKYNEKSELAESTSVLIPQSQKDQAKKEVVDSMLNLLAGNAGIIVPKGAASLHLQKTGNTYMHPFKDREMVVIPDQGRKIDEEALKNNGRNPQAVTEIIPGLSVGDLLNKTADIPSQLRDYLYTLEARPGKGPIGSGAFSSARDYIELGPGNPRQLASTLLHEIQHASQYIYGLPRGGNPEMFFRDYNKFDTANTVVKQRMEALGITPATVLPPNPSSITPTGRNEVLTSPYALQELSKYLNFADSRAIRNYEKLAGEVEARAVQQMYTDVDYTTPVLQLYNELGYPLDHQLLHRDVPNKLVDTAPEFQQMLDFILGRGSMLLSK